MLGSCVSPFELQVTGMLEAVTGIPGRLMQVLLRPESDYSLASLGAALLIATLFLIWRRGKASRPVRLAVIGRALFPRRMLASASVRADAKYFVLNVLFLGSLLSWAIVSSIIVSAGVNGALVDLFGAQKPTTLHPLLVTAIVTVMLFLAFEFAYWFEHWLSHAVPVLWEFHKVHHSAEILTPLTNARIHPVNALIYLNLVGLSVGTMRGLLDYLFGMPVQPFTLAHTNVLFVLFTYLTTHLQHSHVWIAFTGVLGRLILSPAHHQIHHSTDPRHFNKNFGSSLAIFDWMAGTLYVPSAEREKLNFGVDDLNTNHNTLVGGLAGPFLAVWALGLRALRRGRRPSQPRPIAAE